MKQSKRSKYFYRMALVNINNAYDRILCLEESLNFQGFGDSIPEIVVTNDVSSYGISLWWNDTIIDMESVFEALDGNGSITPEILENLIRNINN